MKRHCNTIGFILGLLLVMPASAQVTDRAPVVTPAATPSADEAPDLVRRYQETITPEDLASHLYFFASDFFEGRETGQPGQKLAAHYLASQYRKMGVQPAGTAAPENLRSPEAYFQPVPLYAASMARSELSLTAGDGTMATSVFSAKERDGRSYVAFGGGETTSGEVVFGGFGISDPEHGYDDFAALTAAGIDYTTGWLLILGGEPVSADGTPFLTDDGTPSRWASSANSKFQGLFRAGMPQGILMVADLGSGPSMVEAANAQAEQLSRPGRLSLDAPEQAGPSRRSFPPIYMISSDLADQLLSGTGRSVASIAREIGTSREPVVFGVDGATATSTMSFDTLQMPSENVLGFVEGSDPDLKHEIVVVSSHYDHVGMNEVAEGEDGIFNGADDDGSGTVTVLEIAEAFSRARADGYGPRRSILFLNVTGEEKGLLGSAYYTDREPVFPIENTVVDLNIDMIGRVDPTHPGEDDDYVYIIGSNLISQELHDINVRVNSLLGTNLDLNERFNSKDDPNQFYRRSDHWNFGKQQIPFIFFFTGTHEDYHGVDDEPDKILYERMARIGQLIFATAWQVANQDERPTVSGTGFN